MSKSYDITGKFYRARSPLYRNQILQLFAKFATRWKALAEIYTMHLNRIPR